MIEDELIHEIRMTEWEFELSPIQILGSTRSGRYISVSETKISMNKGNRAKLRSDF